MRVLVHGGAAADARLSRALGGLADRGHLVGWAGGEPTAGAGAAEQVPEREIGARAWDVVVGAGAPRGAVALGRRSGARAMVQSAGAEALLRASWLDRLAWGDRSAVVLIDESDAGAARGGSHGVALERFGLWPAAGPDGPPPISHPETEVLERACERALARSLGPAPRAALFVDRDGTLIVEHGYLDDPAGVELLPGVATALREARAGGHPVVVVSNQSGVGRGRFTLERAFEVMAALRRRLRLEHVELDAIHFCPHEPGAGCRCRKPGSLLFERAAADLQIHLPHSVMVGDKRLDAHAGQAAGMLGLLVGTGYGGGEGGEPGADPDGVFGDLGAAVRWFLRREEARVIG